MKKFFGRAEAHNRGIEIIPVSIELTNVVELVLRPRALMPLEGGYIEIVSFGLKLLTESADDGRSL